MWNSNVFGHAAMVKGAEALQLLSSNVLVGSWFTVDGDPPQPQLWGAAIGPQRAVCSAPILVTVVEYP